MDNFFCNIELLVSKMNLSSMGKNVLAKLLAFVCKCQEPFLKVATRSKLNAKVGNGTRNTLTFNFDIPSNNAPAT